MSASQNDKIDKFHSRFLSICHKIDKIDKIHPHKICHHKICPHKNDKNDRFPIILLLYYVIIIDDEMMKMIK